MTQPTIIPKGTHIVTCTHLDADNVVTYWFLFEEGDLPVALCETCHPAFLATGTVPDGFLLQVLNVDRFPRIPSTTIH
jgi:hypothetical protein